MELSFNGLAERAEEFFSGLARDQKNDGDFDVLFREETYLRVREATQSPKTDDETKAWLLRFLEFLRWARIYAASADARRTREAQLERPILSSLRTMTLREGLERIASDASRERRHALERDANDALWERQGAWAQVVEANIRTADTTRSRTIEPSTAVGTNGEPKPVGWPTAAEKLLLATEDAYRDLLGYALKRIDPLLKPSTARLHDLQHLGTAPHLMQYFREEELRGAVDRTFDALQLPSTRLVLHDGPARVAAVRLPDEVHLTVDRRGGLDACEQLLADFGEAQLWSRGNSRLIEPVLVAGVRAFFSAFTLEAGWLKRMMLIPAALAKEAARHNAFIALTRLRFAAALLPYAIELRTRGPRKEMAEEYEDRLTRALMVGIPRGGFLTGVDDPAPLALRAAVVAAGFQDEVRDKFDEDYFRNPGLGTWFSGLAARAGVLSTVPDAAHLVRVGQRLVRLMGA